MLNPCLALNMPPVIGDAPEAPQPDIHRGPEQHGRVQSSHLPLDVSLELHQSGRPWAVHF